MPPGGGFPPVPGPKQFVGRHETEVGRLQQLCPTRLSGQNEHAGWARLRPASSRGSEPRCGPKTTGCSNHVLKVSCTQGLVGYVGTLNLSA